MFPFDDIIMWPTYCDLGYNAIGDTRYHRWLRQRVAAKQATSQYLNQW